MTEFKSATSAADEIMRQAKGALDPLSTISSGSLIDKATRDALNGSLMGGAAGLGDKPFGTNQNLIDAAMGRIGPSPLAKAVDDMKGLRGLDHETYSAITGSLGKYESASASLAEEMAKGQRRDIFGHREIDQFRMPALPDLPPNPIHKTNELLDEMVGELSEQRSLIEAAAEAQKRETELLGTLVEAFTANQAASDQATRRSHMQAWIGIGIAVITLVAAFFVG